MTGTSNSTSQPRTRRSRKKAPVYRPPWRTAPCGFKHQMEPLYLGLAASEFVSPDPEQWFGLAIDAGGTFWWHEERFGTSEAGWRDDDWRFLVGWAQGAGAFRAIGEWMAARGIVGVRDGKLIRARDLRHP